MAVQYNADGSFKRDADSEIAKAQARYRQANYVGNKPTPSPYYSGPAWNPNAKSRAEGNKQKLREAIYNKYVKSQHPSDYRGEDTPNRPNGPDNPNRPDPGEHPQWGKTTKEDPTPSYNSGYNRAQNTELSDGELAALTGAALPGAFYIGGKMAHLLPGWSEGARYYANNPLQLAEGLSTAAKAAPYTPVGGYSQLGMGPRAAAQARVAAQQAGNVASAFKGTPVGGYSQLGEGLGTKASRVTPNFYQGARGVASNLSKAAGAGGLTMLGDAAMLAAPFVVPAAVAYNAYNDPEYQQALANSQVENEDNRDIAAEQLDQDDENALDAAMARLGL